MRMRSSLLNGNGNGYNAGNQSPDQIAGRQPATLINTGYPTAGGTPASVSPMVPAAAGQNTTAGAVVNAGLGWTSGRVRLAPRRASSRRASPRRASRSSPKRKRASSAAAPRRKRASSRRAKPARLVKGSAAARRYMAKIRRMRKRR